MEKKETIEKNCDERKNFRNLWKILPNEEILLVFKKWLEIELD